MPFVTQYLDYTDLRDEMRKKIDLSPKECRILRVITRKYVNQEIIMVSDLIGMSEIASPVTIHSVTKTLIKKEMVTAKQNKDDGRIKYLVPSAKALKVFNELGRLIK